MTTAELIKMGTVMGLEFREKTNYKDSLENGIVVFDGCNGQRSSIDSSWREDVVFEALGKALVLKGKRLKALEISQALSINND